MTTQHINKIRNTLNDILGLKLGNDFFINQGKFLYEELGFDTKHIDGFWVGIDYDFWNDEEDKRNTFNKLAKVFPSIEYCDDDVLAHIPFGYDNFPSN
tara:strand:+ start:8 stop:301 length:294 start_codon:yes stop_codon:yes gene_type:complete